FRSATEKIGDSRIAEFQLPCATQVNDSCQGYRSREKRLVRRQPECQMASRRVTYRDHTIQVQLESVRHRGHIDGASGHIVKCSGPTATRISDPPILQIPDREPRVGERFANRPHVFEIIIRAPESAVYDDHDRM